MGMQYINDHILLRKREVEYHVKVGVSEVDKMLGADGLCRALLETWLFVKAISPCRPVWRGKLMGNSPRLLSKGAVVFGYDARELWWCVVHGADRIPEGSWLYRTCKRKRCMDPEHMFVGPAGLSRTLGKMQEVGFPVGLLVVDGRWVPDPEMLKSWRRWVRRENMTDYRRKSVQRIALSPRRGRV